MAYRATVLVISSAPPDYPSWPRAEKIRRMQAKLQWHSYIRHLHDIGKVPWVWGTLALVSGFTSSTHPQALVSIYDCDGLDEYSKLLEADPLFHFSCYLTIPLRSLVDDAQADLAGGPNIYIPPQAGALEAMYVAMRRALFRSQPNYVGNTVAVPSPANAKTDVNANYDGTVSYLLYGTAPDEYVNWDDHRRSIMDQKVEWWHSYASALVNNGQMTHGWAIQPFCHSTTMASYRKGGIVVLNSSNLTELQTAYEANPLIDEARFVSLALRPLKEQQVADESHLKALTVD